MKLIDSVPERHSKREAVRLAEEKKGSESFLAICAEKNVKVFVPGPTDGAVGSQLWLFWQSHKDFTLDIFGEEHQYYLPQIL